MTKQNSAIRENISKHITNFLNETHMSKAKFGKMLGVTATSVTRWIEMQCAPDIDLIPKIADLMNVSILNLYGINSNNITPREMKIIDMYINNSQFSNLVDRYLTDEEFRKSINYFTSIK